MNRNSNIEGGTKNGGRSFGNVHIRKTRIGLKEYKIGKRGGIRFICMVFVDIEKVITLAIYTEKDYNTETSIQTMIKKNLKSIDSALGKK